VRLGLPEPRQDGQIVRAKLLHVELPAELVQSLGAWILERTNRPLETARGLGGPLKGGLGIRCHSRRLGSRATEPTAGGVYAA